MSEDREEENQQSNPTLDGSTDSRKCGLTSRDYNQRQESQIVNAFRRIWSLDGDVNIIVPNFSMDRYELSPQTRKEISQEIAAHGNIAYRSDLVAASMIEWLLITLTDYRNVRIVFDLDVDLSLSKFSDSNIISIAGPFSNSVTRKLFEILHIESPFAAEEDGIRVTLNLNGKRYTPIVDEDGGLLSDYGMIYKRRSPLSKEKRYVYIFAGGRGYGTQGAAAALAIVDIVYKVFCEDKKNTEEFSLPVKVYSPSSEPLYFSREEMFVCGIQPETPPCRNYNDAVATVARLYSYPASLIERLEEERARFKSLLRGYNPPFRLFKTATIVFALCAFSFLSWLWFRIDLVHPVFTLLGMAVSVGFMLMARAAGGLKRRDENR